MSLMLSFASASESLAFRPIGSVLLAQLETPTVDAQTARSLTPMLVAGAQRSLGRLVVSLEAVEAIEPRGIQMLRELGEISRMLGGRLAVVVPEGPVRDAIEATGLSERIGLAGSIDEAIGRGVIR